MHVCGNSFVLLLLENDFSSIFRESMKKMNILLNVEEKRTLWIRVKSNSPSL